MNKELVIYSEKSLYGNQEQNNIEIVSRDVESGATVPYNVNNTDSDYLEAEADFFDIIFNMLLFFLIVQCFMRLYLYFKSYNARTQLQITLNNDNYNFNRIILKDEFENDTCSICLDDLYSDENQDEIIQIKCNHMFHKKCLDEWILQQRNCPLCKVEL
jgi:hypothetical protein